MTPTNSNLLKLTTVALTLTLFGCTGDRIVLDGGVESGTDSLGAPQDAAFAIPGAGADRIGEVCNSEAECNGGFCLDLPSIWPACTNKVCTIPCEARADEFGLEYCAEFSDSPTSGCVVSDAWGGVSFCVFSSIFPAADCPEP